MLHKDNFQVKTIILSKSSWKCRREEVPVVTLQVKECLSLLFMQTVPHPPEDFIRRTIRSHDLRATFNTSQWFHKRGLNRPAVSRRQGAEGVHLRQVHSFGRGGRPEAGQRCAFLIIYGRGSEITYTSPLRQQKLNGYYGILNK